MRRATAADAPRIAVIARLDSRRLPAGPFLVAELGGEIVAAQSLSSGAVVADPFRPTADAVAILGLRAAQIDATGEPAGRTVSRRSASRTTAAHSFEHAATA